MTAGPQLGRASRWDAFRVEGPLTRSFLTSVFSWRASTVCTGGLGRKPGPSSDPGEVGVKRAFGVAQTCVKSPALVLPNVTT